MDVKAAMTTAINRTTSFKIAEFSTWPLLYQFKACRTDGERVTVKPDGFIRIHETEPDGGLSEHTFFLEVDRSHEVQEILAEKAACYVDYYRSGGFAVRNGKVPEQYKDFPFRVLMVCKTEERRDNAARRLLENTPPILTFVLVATLSDCLHDPTGNIWVRPRDYRQETADVVPSCSAQQIRESIISSPVSA